jgi:hypothetical protein
MRPSIAVVGYPKSGTTWLCRLIADAWDCPIGSIHSEDVFHGHAAEGKDRQGPFVVKHGHSPPDKLRKHLSPGDFVFFIYRDPRDVIVSISHYFDRPLDECIDNAINGRPNAKGPLRFPIGDYVKMWMNSFLAEYTVGYEHLHIDAISILYDISEILGLGIEPINNLNAVIYRQSFAQRKKWTEQHGDKLTFGKEYHLKFLRKGIVGDWKNHFTVEQLARVETGMDGLGYW